MSCPAVGLQQVAGVELREPVGANDLPVRSAWNHLSANVGALEGAAENRNDLLTAAWTRPVGWRAHLHADE